MTLSFSTATVDERAQLDYWRDVVCATFVQLKFETSRRPAGTGFRGAVTARELDGVRVATVVSEPHTVVRSPTMIRRSFADDFFVNLAVRGRIALTQDGREAVLRPGDLTVYDSAHPCRITGLDPFELVVLRVPRPLFAAHCPLPREATATPVRGDRGVGALLSPLLRSLAGQTAAELPPGAAARVGASMLELLATALSDRTYAGARPAVPRRRTWSGPAGTSPTTSPTPSCHPPRSPARSACRSATSMRSSTPRTARRSAGSWSSGSTGPPACSPIPASPAGASRTSPSASASRAPRTSPGRSRTASASDPATTAGIRRARGR